MSYGKHGLKTNVNFEQRIEGLVSFILYLLELYKQNKLRKMSHLSSTVNIQITTTYIDLT